MKSRSLLSPQAGTEKSAAPQPIVLMWFRRDLRLEDNAALFHALQSGYPVLPLFVFDTHILSDLEDPTDRRVVFIHHALHRLLETLQRSDTGMEIRVGTPLQVFEALLTEYDVRAVFSNRDYESYALQRDAAIAAYCREKSAGFLQYKDHVVFEKEEVLKDNGEPYSIYTPYSRRWKERLAAHPLPSFPVAAHRANFLKGAPRVLPSLEQIGFRDAGGSFPPAVLSPGLLQQYRRQRDFPALEGTSRLGVHLRFGTASIRELVKMAALESETFLNELIWRDFFQMVLQAFPQVNAGKAFKPEYDRIRWRNQEAEFRAWCEGRTGYPLVDAGMRQLNATGFMHNRVRMVTASFLAKHLLVDWRWGEAYFATKLLDYDFAANNGGWQWAAGCGCDAAPYFRIFNPTLQAKKFDPDGSYIRQWIPELNGFGYPAPVVDHDFARARCLEYYQAALRKH